jgi:hypothetical protein
MPRQLGASQIIAHSCNLLASGHFLLPSNILMAEKVNKLRLERDYKKFLYFIDGQGNVCKKPKSGEGETEVVVPNAVERDNQFLYFIDKEGDVARSPRAARKTKKAA